MLRPCRAIDMAHFCIWHLPTHFAGIVCEEDGELIGLGAIIIGENRRPWVVLDARPRMREKKVTLHRIGKLIVRAGIEQFGKVYVMRSQKEPGSERWLKRLGFRDMGELYRGEIVMEAG